MEPAIIVALGIAGTIGLLGVVIVAVVKKERERREAMRQVAATMGFRFAEKQGADDVAPFVGELPLFQRGHSKKAPAVLTGETAGRPVTVLDWQFTVGGGKNSHTYQQTVVVFPEVGGLPDFEAAPEHLLHRIGQVFGYQDIDIESDEAFSKAVLLRGNDEAAIRRVFNANVRGLMRREAKLSIESRGGRLAIYRSGKRCEPAQVPAFLADALRIENELVKGA
jgi:hypothetical protein